MSEPEEPQFVSLANLCRGAAIERVDHEMERVLRNVLDVNAGAAASREVVLRVRFKPNKERTSCAVEVHCHSTLAPAEALSTTFFIGLDGGRAVAREYDPKQMVLPGVQNARVTPLREVK